MAKTRFPELKPKVVLGVAAHASQMPGFGGVNVRATDWSETAGKEFGFKHAEGFMRIDIA